MDRSQDRRLGVFAHDSVLAPDSSYTGTAVIQLPPAIYGTGYLFMVTDHDNQVYEHAWEFNNSRRNAIEITLTPPPDLVVTELHIPASAQSGQEITVSWTVQNQGPGAPFESDWNDRVYLSQIS